MIAEAYSSPIRPTKCHHKGCHWGPEPDRIIGGTINAYQHGGQAALINELIARDKTVIAIAQRMPYDVSAYPRVPTCLCTYSLQSASLQAAAKVLWGQIAASGQLPVNLPPTKQFDVQR